VPALTSRRLRTARRCRSRAPGRTNGGATASLQEAGGTIKVRRPDVEEARKQLSALMDEPETAAASLGHVWYKRYVDRFSEWLDQHGDRPEAKKALDQLFETLSRRKVKDAVLREIDARRAAYARK
jgi:hypothetical protein